MAIRIVIADDADLVIEGVKSVLNTDHCFMLVGTARCMDDLLTLIDSVSPDVVVLGEWIYSLDILSAVEAIHTVNRTMKTIVMGRAGGWAVNSGFIQWRCAWILI